MNVLEPASGDGRFLPQLKRYSENITAIELDESKINAYNTLSNTNVTLKCADCYQKKRPIR